MGDVGGRWGPRLGMSMRSRPEARTRERQRWREREGARKKGEWLAGWLRTINQVCAVCRWMKPISLQSPGRDGREVVCDWVRQLLAQKGPGASKEESTCRGWGAEGKILRSRPLRVVLPSRIYLQGGGSLVLFMAVRRPLVLHPFCSLLFWSLATIMFLSIFRASRSNAWPKVSTTEVPQKAAPGPTSCPAGVL